MSHRSLLLSLGLVGLGIVITAPASATKVRRPFAPAKSFGYGFDNNGTAGGCTDHECGGRCYNGHGGTDYPLVVGTQVLAGADGTVVSTNNGCANYGGLGSTCGGGCGNYVKIQHADGHFTLFCHMQLGSLTVSTGQKVKCGQVVGKSASSGNSSGPHLHFAWRTSGNANINSYSGKCSKYPSAWVSQGSYNGATGAQCECAAGTETCNGKDDDCDGQVDEGDVCETQMLQRSQFWLAPARTTDIDGDGQADVCGRGAAGFWCHLSQGSGWSDKGPTLALADSSGWDDATNWGTLRMGDLDGDGKADLCARANAGVVCWKSDGTGLNTKIEGPEWSDASGWNKIQFYSTLRLLDVDGDHKDDLCARAAKGIVCVRSTGSAFEGAFEGPEWSDSAGFDLARYYGTLRTGDVNGDGKDDLCIRTKTGMECRLSNGAGYGEAVVGPEWSDAKGWSAMKYWSTIRLVDVNGDGRADLCARDSKALRCHLSTGTSFGEAIEVAPLGDDTGWDDESNYLTLRSGDIDGDGAQDLCLRANAKVLCYRFRAGSFDRVEGPEWSDDSGWNKPEYFHTMQLGDMNGDARADLCARYSKGWMCVPSTGDGFGAPVQLDEFSDQGGWAAQHYYATIALGGPVCVPRDEVCNGKDDDCDGEIDDGVCGLDGGSWTGGAGGAGGAGGSGAASGGSSSGADPDSADGSCGCRVVGRRDARAEFVGLMLAFAVAVRRRRRGPPVFRV